MSTRLSLCVLACAVALCAQQTTNQSIQNAVDAYRRMWQAMTAEQRKTLVDAGGGTPERYEQTLRMQQTGGGGPKTSAGIEAQSVTTDLKDTVRTSSEDRHAIRDANLVRLKDEACPAEIALEVAALRSSFAPAAMPPSAAMLAIADSWFQRSPVPSTPSKPANAKADLERLLTECKK